MCNNGQLHMWETTVWILVFLLGYAAYCTLVGVRCSRRSGDPRESFSPPGGIATWTFVISTTAAMFAGWTMTGHPGQVFRDGFQFVNASFFVIVIPLAGIFLQKRQWLLGQKYGYLTPGEMYASYFGGAGIAAVSTGIALLFAVPFLGMLFSAAGALLHGLTGGTVPHHIGMWGLAAVVLVYCVTGGLRAVAQTAIVQGALFIGAMIVIGVFSAELLGGFPAIGQSLAAFASSAAVETSRTYGFGGGDYNGLFALPGVIQWTSGLGIEQPVGGPWTTAMCLSFALSLMGLQTAPVFSVWCFVSRTPRAFGISQIWGSAFCIGIILFFFSTLQGIGAHLLGADGAANEANLSSSRLLPVLSNAEQGDLVQHYIAAIGSQYPWLAGLLAVAAIAALQCTSAAYLAAAGNIGARDIYKHYLDKHASWGRQETARCIAMLLMCLGALILASFGMKAALILAALVVPFSFQLLPSLLGVLWWPWMTRRAATLGLIAGLVVVVLTEPLGQVLTGNSLPWGRWPWTIHSGMWGMFVNLAICIIATVFGEVDADRPHRNGFHQFLRQTAALSGSSRMRSAAWILLLVWVFFAVGPGSVLGNGFFGDPDSGYETWVFGTPPIWAWQVFWWLAGVGLVWLLGEKMGLSTISDQDPAAATIGGGLDDR